MKRGPKAQDLASRFWKKVEKESFERTEGLGPCWRWTAMLDKRGYGRFGTGTWKNVKVMLAHRMAYILTHGDIPFDLVLDHLCRFTSCVNPAHLDPCSNGENVSRAIAHYKSVTSHCKQGHPWNDENTAARPNGSRYCRQCNRDNASRHRRSRKEAA